ncbi:hypothetical protein [Desulfopila sp. IMCC35008]|uniref:hypothetical protein n=1 Tax=Desulfopila sp. IMCC35008 TaxID=2653858 RepID=UPI0013D42EA9|nr:hypothetical protein [Desulfopila sp. IMCC35008]
MAINQLFSTRFEDALEHLKQGLGIKRRLKKYEKVVEKIGRLKQQFSKAAKLYTVQVEKDDKTGNAKTITWQRKPAPKTTDTYPGYTACNYCEYKMQTLNLGEHLAPCNPVPAWYISEES